MNDDKALNDFMRDAIKGDEAALLKLLGMFFNLSRPSQETVIALIAKKLRGRTRGRPTNTTRDAVINEFYKDLREAGATRDKAIALLADAYHLSHDAIGTIVGSKG